MLVTQVHGPPPAPIYHHYTNTAEVVTYLTRGAGAAVEYTVMFTYMGFRYVRLTGYPGSVVGVSLARPVFTKPQGHGARTHAACMLMRVPHPAHQWWYCL